APVAGITGIIPSEISQNQTVSAVINGSGFTNASAVHFSADAPVTASITSVSDTQIRMQLTASSIASTGAQNFTVTVPSGSISSEDIALKVAAAVTSPTISSVSPGNGMDSGGMSVTITGTGFHPLSQVTFGDREAVILSNSSTQLVVSAPPGEAGQTTIIVQNPDGSTAQATFLYTP